jgi:CRP-like cAMP-binding protein
MERVSAIASQRSEPRMYAHRADRRRSNRKASVPVVRSSPMEGRLENHLLGLLPDTVAARLKPHLELVHLERGQFLFRAHDPLRAVYFPSTAVVSLVSRLQSGDMLEVGLVGRDGLVGTAVVPGVTTMPCDAIVQVPGFAQRVGADILRSEALADESLSAVIGRFAQMLLARSMQISACNMFHPVEQRCMRWLLTVSDLIGRHDIPLTHDLLATMLGVHRPTVTLVIRSFHRAGLVKEERGLIGIRDRKRLLAACCECYQAMRNECRILGY